MGYIKEPTGVDFVINSGVLSNEDRKEISKAIAELKRKSKIRKATKPSRKNTHNRVDG